MKNKVRTRLRVAAAPVALVALLAGQAHADPVDDWRDYVEYQLAQAVSGGAWVAYADSQADLLVSDAGVLQSRVAGEANGFSTDPGVAIPLGADEAGQAAASAALAIDNSREEPDDQRVEKELNHWGPAVVPSSGGMQFFEFSTWQLNPGDERVTFKTKACNEPSNRRGGATWDVVRDDGKYKEIAIHTCADRREGADPNSEPVWYDAMIVGNDQFITYGRTYHLRLYWSPTCSGENSPVSDGRPHLTLLEEDPAPESDCRHIKMYSAVSTH